MTAKGGAKSSGSLDWNIRGGTSSRSRRPPDWIIRGQSAADAPDWNIRGGTSSRSPPPPPRM